MISVSGWGTAAWFCRNVFALVSQLVFSFTFPERASLGFAPSFALFNVGTLRSRLPLKRNVNSKDSQLVVLSHPDKIWENACLCLEQVHKGICPETIWAALRGRQVRSEECRPNEGRGLQCHRSDGQDRRTGRRQSGKIQPGDLVTAVESVEAGTTKMAGHVVKRLAVATGEDGGPAGCPQLVDDCENTVFEGKTPGCASDDPRGKTDLRPLTWSEPQGS